MVTDALPAQMTAVLLTGHGGPERLEVRHDVPVPQVAAGEVLVQVAAAGINNTDINTRLGWYAKSVTGGTDQSVALPAAADDDGGWSGAIAFPRIQGADAAGRIVAVGAGVAAGRVGQRVLIEPCLRRQDATGILRADYLGSERDGAFAQYVAVPASHAHGVNSALSDSELAAVPCAGSTAANLLTRTAVGAGDRVLVTGASGGVGSFA
ncbi:MAG: alcohol dehydrogenase catalytic domain-containing protein, partial [Alphaproteobacteria bacterium]